MTMFSSGQDKDPELLNLLLSENQSGPDLAAALERRCPPSDYTALGFAVAYSRQDRLSALIEACR